MFYSDHGLGLGFGLGLERVGLGFGLDTAGLDCKVVTFAKTVLATQCYASTVHAVALLLSVRGQCYDKSAEQIQLAFSTEASLDLSHTVL